jgi:hypothetical protein
MDSKQIRIEAMKLLLEYVEYRRNVAKDKGNIHPEIYLKDLVADAKTISNFIETGF